MVMAMVTSPHTRGSLILNLFKILEAERVSSASAVFFLFSLRYCCGKTPDRSGAQPKSQPRGLL